MPTPASPASVLRWKIGVSVVLLAAIAGLVAIAVTGLLGDRSEHRGVVTVSGCTFRSYAVHSNLYSCYGSFAADDLRVPYVTFVNSGRIDPGARLAATVSGPDDDTAHLVSEGWWRLAVTGGGALLLTVPLIAIWRRPRRRPAILPPPA